MKIPLEKKANVSGDWWPARVSSEPSSFYRLVFRGFRDELDRTSVDER